MYTAVISFFFSLITCLCFYFLRGKDFNGKNIIWLVYFVMLALSSYLFFSKVIYRMENAEIWDFTAFFLYGKVAAGGYDFYKPENFHHVFTLSQLPASYYDALKVEVLDVGFPYPPPTILYFLPLGYLSYNTALVGWTIFNVIIVFACIYLIYDQFFKTEKLNGLMLVATLFFYFIPVKSTVLYSQTNFILLLYLLLMNKYADKKIAGLFLALAIFTKPYAVVFGLFFVVRKKWGGLVYAALSGLVLCGLILLLFGKAPFLSYIYDNPSHRIPLWVFSEDINQSLHGVLLRANLITMDKTSAYVYIVLAVLLLAGTHLFYLLRRKLYDYVFALLLLIGLLLYPGTLSYYGVLLLFIIFQFFDEKKQLGFNPFLNILIVSAVFCLGSFSVFSLFCFLLIIIVIKSLTRSLTTDPRAPAFSMKVASFDLGRIFLKE